MFHQPFTFMKERHLLGFWILVSLAGIAVTSMLYIQEQKDKMEEYNRYEIALSSYSEEDIIQFCSDFPESKYLEMLKLRRKQIINIRKEWDFLKSYGSKTDLLDFIRKYPQSPFAYECENLIDSLDWHDAAKTGNTEALIQYMEMHPGGKYVAEARKAKKEIEKTILNQNERATLNRIMDKLKTAIDHGDTGVYREPYMQNVSISDSARMRFLFNHYMTITNIGQTWIKKKVEKDSSSYVAKVNFSFVQKHRDSVENIKIALTALFNKDFKIKKIILK